MNGFLLDTNVFSEFSRTHEPNPQVKVWLKETDESSLFLSVIVFAEIRLGIETLPASKKRTRLEMWQNEFLASFENRLLPITRAIGSGWAVLVAEARRRGLSIDTADGLIAATALEHDLILVTRDVNDFAGVPIRVLNRWHS